jgi:Dimerisation domain
MPKKSRRKKQVTPERLMELSFAYAPPLIISAAVSNKVFDSLEDGAKTSERVAEKTGASARALRILMNALVGLDLLKKIGKESIRLRGKAQPFLLAASWARTQGFLEPLRRRSSHDGYDYPTSSAKVVRPLR